MFTICCCSDMYACNFVMVTCPCFIQVHSRFPNETVCLTWPVSVNHYCRFMYLSGCKKVVGFSCLWASIIRVHIRCTRCCNDTCSAAVADSVTEWQHSHTWDFAFLHLYLFSQFGDIRCHKAFFFQVQRCMTCYIQLRNFLVPHYMRRSFYECTNRCLMWCCSFKV